MASSADPGPRSRVRASRSPASGSGFAATSAGSGVGSGSRTGAGLWLGHGQLRLGGRRRRLLDGRPLGLAEQQPEPRHQPEAGRGSERGRRILGHRLGLRLLSRHLNRLGHGFGFGLRHEHRFRGARLGRRRLRLRRFGLRLDRRERHPRSPSRRLDPHRAAYALALPGNGGLGFESRDPDLPERPVKVPGQRRRVAAFGPELGRGLDEGSARLRAVPWLWDFAWPPLTPSAARLCSPPPGVSDDDPTWRPRTRRIAHRLGLHGDVRDVRAGRREESIATDPRGARRRHQPARHGRLLRDGPQRAADRRGARRPQPRRGPDQRQVRRPARPRRSLARLRRSPAGGQDRARVLAQRLRHRPRRRLPPGAAGPERPDRGDDRRDRRAGRGRVRPPHRALGGRPETIRRAAAVHPIATCRSSTRSSLAGSSSRSSHLPRAGIGITAYGVLSRGLLSGHFTRPRAGSGDMRRAMPRFQGENLRRNLELVEALQGNRRRDRRDDPRSSRSRGC